MKETAEEILKLSAARDARCAMSLRVSSLAELGTAFDTAEDSHFLVTMIGDSAKCKTCVTPSVCRCLRDHFQSTTNSKRRVSTYLFWKNKLGLLFPVSDDMLERQVWQNLESCDYGIKKGNGQRKQRSGPVCVNPYHYEPGGIFEVMAPLLSTLQLLGYTSDGYISKTLEGLGWDGKKINNTESRELGMTAFQIIAARVRQMEEENRARLASQQGVAPTMVTAVPVEQQKNLLQPPSTTTHSLCPSPASSGGMSPHHANSPHATPAYPPPSHADSPAAYSVGQAPSPALSYCSSHHSSSQSQSQSQGGEQPRRSGSDSSITSSQYTDPMLPPKYLLVSHDQHGDPSRVSDGVVPDESLLEQALSDVDQALSDVDASDVGKADDTNDLDGARTHKRMRKSAANVGQALIQDVQGMQYSQDRQLELNVLEMYLRSMDEDKPPVEEQQQDAAQAEGQQQQQQPQTPGSRKLSADVLMQLSNVNMTNAELDALLATNINPVGDEGGNEGSLFQDYTSKMEEDERGFLQFYSGIEFVGDGVVPQLQQLDESTARQTGHIRKYGSYVSSGSMARKLSIISGPEFSAGHLVALIPAQQQGEKIQVQKLTLENLPKAKYCGVLQPTVSSSSKEQDGGGGDAESSDKQSNMLAVLGTGKLMVRGPANPGDVIYADLKRDHGCGVCQKPTIENDEDRLFVIGKVIHINLGAETVDEETEHLVTAAISFPADLKKGGEVTREDLTRIAKMRHQLRKLKDKVLNDEDIESVVQELGTVSVSEKPAVAVEDTKTAATATTSSTNHSHAAAPFLKRCSSVDDGVVVTFISHVSKKALRVDFGNNNNASNSDDSKVKVDANGNVAASAMFVVCGSATKLSLQSVLDDEAWLCVNEDQTRVSDDMDAAGCSFECSMIDAASNTFVLKGSDGQYVSVSGTDGSVSLTTDANADSTKFTLYSRIFTAA